MVFRFASRRLVPAGILICSSSYLISRKRQLHCSDSSVSNWDPWNLIGKAEEEPTQNLFWTSAPNNDEDNDSDSEQDRLELWNSLKVLLMQLGRISPHHLLSAESISQLSWASVLAGGGGAVVGSMIRHRLNTYVLVATAIGIGARAAIQLKLITIHWDRIEDMKRNFPPQLSDNATKMWNLIWSLPMSGVFASGFLIGFKFL
jgi:uncharacterized membrane protein (Fun14 family)